MEIKEKSIKNNKLKLYFQVFSIGLLAASLLAIPHNTYAADPQDDAAYTCASAINVMDCINQTGTGAPKTQEADITNLPISTQLLGYSGPFTASIRYDNYLAWILDVGYAQSFHNAAAAFKLSAGLNERRANISLGYAITPKQQIKLTYEYLAQNLPFDYASGTVNEWVNQNAFGAAYRYIVGHDILKSLELYGAYTKAGSKELSDVEMYTDNVLTQINQRRIAGGTEETAGGSVTLTPFKTTEVKLGAGYSTLNFDTQWEDSESNATIAYNAEVRQLLTPHMLVSAGIGHTASGSTYTARVSHILPWSLEASLIGQYADTTGGIPGATSVTASLSYPAPKTYENVATASLGAIKDWVMKPVVYNTRVLAKAEERILEVQITTNPIPAINIPVGDDLNPPITTNDYFNFDTEVYDNVSYHILSIVNAGDGKPADTNLNLQVTPTDSYHATLSSSAPTNEAMMSPGQYIVSLQAQGVRNGQIVSQVENPITISVGTNPNLQENIWNTTVPLAAAPGQMYSQDIRKLVTNQSNVSDETFTFTLVDSDVTWLAIGGDDNQYLVSTQEVTSAASTINVTLQGQSQASNQMVQPNPQPFTIAITDLSPTAPVWSAAIISNAKIQFDCNTASCGINLTNYIQSGADSSLTMAFDSTTTDTTGWEILSDGADQATGAPIYYLVRKPVPIAFTALGTQPAFDAEGIGQTWNLKITASNSAGQSSTPATFSQIAPQPSENIVYQTVFGGNPGGSLQLTYTSLNKNNGLFLGLNGSSGTNTPNGGQVLAFSASSAIPIGNNKITIPITIPIIVLKDSQNVFNVQNTNPSDPAWIVLFMPYTEDHPLTADDVGYYSGTISGLTSIAAGSSGGSLSIQINIDN